MTQKSLYRVRVKRRVNVDDTTSWLADQTVRAESPKGAAQTFVDADVNWLDEDIELFVSPLGGNITVYTSEDLE